MSSATQEALGPLHDYMLVMVHLLNASVSKKILVKEQERQEAFDKIQKKKTIVVMFPNLGRVSELRTCVRT